MWYNLENICIKENIYMGLSSGFFDKPWLWDIHTVDITQEGTSTGTRNDLIVAWRTTGGQKEGRKEGKRKKKEDC